MATVKPFFRIRNQDPSLDRQLQQIQQVLTAITPQAHGPTAVSTLMTILPTQTGQVYAIVSGRINVGTTKSFVDVVLYDPLHGTTITVLSSTSTGTAAADARTYALSSGALRLTMALNTYNVTVYPTVLS